MVAVIRRQHSVSPSGAAARCGGRLATWWCESGAQPSSLFLGAFERDLAEMLPCLRMSFFAALRVCFAVLAVFRLDDFFVAAPFRLRGCDFLRALMSANDP